MPWPWETTPKKPAFPPAPNTPVVSETQAAKGRIDKLISGKNQRKRTDDAIKNSGG